MAGTVPELVRAVIGRTGLPKVYCEQRARALQDAGLLPVGVGRRVEAARPRDLARLLLALASDRVRTAPATVQRYSELCQPSVEVPRALLWRAAAPERRDTAGDAIERWVADIFGGDRAARRIVLEIDKTIGAVHLHDPTGPSVQFLEPGAFMARPLDSVRSTLQVPGAVIAGIGADMGMRGCANAA